MHPPSGEISGLEVLGFAATDPRISLSADSFGVAPGAQIELDIALGDASLPETFSWEICLVTNDPDEPLLTLTIASTDSNTDGALGSQAPDFVAEDLDGGLHALSDHLGQPVLLAFFATWCPICAYETSDIDKALYQVYADQGWEGMGDWLGTGNIRSGEWRDFESARQYARKLGLRNWAEWQQWSKGELEGKPQRPADIP
ncbi:MAG: redoxin domain-containing protein, partial [Actinomycetales bacterium]|nr:redoxin domain-containing protein [Actinomycetales bacterium]